MHIDTITTLPQTTLPETNLPETDHTAAGLLAHVHDDETGAQAMEYAALAGGGVTAVTLISWILNSDAVREALQALVTGLIEKLGESLSGVIPFI